MKRNLKKIPQNHKKSKMFEVPIKHKKYSTVELFAGAGGLALGLEHAGLHCVLLNEYNRHACATLEKNRPNWHINPNDITQVDFSVYRGKVDVVTGGFPCQAFSLAGKRLGFADPRGTMFFEFARAIQEIQPLVFIGENVKGLLSHDKGKTMNTIIRTLAELGYDILPPTVLKAVAYGVPQKRERVFIVGLKRGENLNFTYPKPGNETYTLKDALKKGKLYNCDVPDSPGQLYSESKKSVLEHIPTGGSIRSLSEEVQKDYLGPYYYAPGGKSSVGRRIAWHEASPTLLCSPNQQRIDRCHPEETRPFKVREYARIQTFPDEWEFCGPVSQQYRQIGNAVPVNLAKAVGQSVMDTLKQYYRATNKAKNQHLQDKAA